MVKRKLANVSYPVLDITSDENNNITIKTTAPFKSSTTTFKLEQEFDEERMDGKMVKVGWILLVIYLVPRFDACTKLTCLSQSFVEFKDGNKFIQTQRDGDLVIKYIREFADDEIRVVRSN